MVSSVAEILPDALRCVSTCYSDLYVSPSIDQVHETGHLKCFLIVFFMSSASSTDENQIENTLLPSPCCASYLNFISLSIGIDWLDHQTSGSHPLITLLCFTSCQIPTLAPCFAGHGWMWSWHTLLDIRFSTLHFSIGTRISQWSKWELRLPNHSMSDWQE